LFIIFILFAKIYLDVRKKLIKKGNNDIYMVNREGSNEDLILKISFETDKKLQEQKIKV
jgi:hypothetical protein